MHPHIIKLTAAGAAIIIGYKFQIMPAILFGCAAGVISLCHAYLDLATWSRFLNVEVEASEKRLASELTSTHMLAMAKLAGADEALQAEVAGLLSEAHMLPPDRNARSRLICNRHALLDSYRAGLKKVAQARKLIQNYAAS